MMLSIMPVAFVVSVIPPMGASRQHIALLFSCGIELEERARFANTGERIRVRQLS
jgi:hypothetical protein